MYNIGVKQIKTITQKVAYNILDHVSNDFITKFKNGQRKITSFGDIFFCRIEKACLFQQKNMILIADFIKQIGLEESLDSLLPKAGSNRGYKPSQKILSFLSSLILSGEGRYSNIDRLRKDDTIKRERLKK